MSDEGTKGQRDEGKGEMRPCVAPLSLCPSAPSPLISISNLDFAYGDRLVLKHVSLEVEAGSTLGLIGPNGGGKTTLLKLMLALHDPTRGSILIDGMTPRQAIRRGDVIGYLPQRPGCPPGFPINVRQVIQLGLVGKTGVLR